MVYAEMEYPWSNKAIYKLPDSRRSGSLLSRTCMRKREATLICGCLAACIWLCFSRDIPSQHIPSSLYVVDTVMMSYHFNSSSCGSQWWCDDHATPAHAEGGSFKTSLLIFFSLDNKLRYCRHNGLRLLIGSPPLSAQQSRPAAASRLAKIRSMHLWANRLRAPAGLLLYMDIDTLFTTPLEHVFHHRDVRKYRDDVNACVALTTDYPQGSRHQTGVMLIKSDLWSRRLLREWLLLSQSNVSSSEPEKHHLSDQLLWNELIKSREKYESLVRVLRPRSYFNAFPNHSAYTPDALLSASSGSSPEAAAWKHQHWDTLKLPRGDERIGQSLIVHFAGVFGGAAIETGRADVLVSLLAVRGFVDRHLQFLSLLPSTISAVKVNPRTSAKVHETYCDQVSDREAYKLMRSISRYSTLCVDRVYSMFDIEHAEREANQCLRHIYEESRALFMRASQLLDALSHSNRAFVRCGHH